MKIADLNSSDAGMPAIAHDPQRQNISPRHLIEKNKPDIGVRRNPEAVTSPPSDRILMNKLEGANDQSLALAKKIRAVDKTMAQIEEKVRDMRAFLEGVVKAYPPYPPGSNERVHALRQFAALRKQIDQLMMPPPEKPSASFVGELTPTDETDWPQAPAKLNLPEISADAADTDLADAMKGLDKAFSNLQQTHKEFIDDANQIIATLK